MERMRGEMEKRQMTDEEILMLYQKRSEDAIVRTEEKYGRLCFHIAGNILRDRRDLEECVWDTWLAMWNTIPPKVPNPFRTYLCRVAKNLSLKKREYNMAKKRKTEWEISLDELDGCIAARGDVLDELEKKQLTETVMQFLGELPKEKRILFLRRYWLCDSIKELAKDYGISQTGISMRLARIRKELKKHLEKEGYDE